MSSSLKGKEFWLDHDGEVVVLDGIKHRLEVDSYKAKYPREEYVISVHAVPVNKQSKYYKEIKAKLGDDWASNVLESPELESEVLAQLKKRSNPSHSKDSPSVYVGTYGKYAAGSIKGKWLDLEDYESRDEFLEAARDLHKDEEDPELMYQDYQGFPDQYYSESSLPEELWDWLKLDEDDRKMLEAYVEVVGADYADIDSARDAYMGTFDSEEEWAMDLVDQIGGIDQLGEQALYYFRMSPTDIRIYSVDYANSVVGDMNDREIRKEAENRGIDAERDIDEVREDLESGIASDLSDQLEKDAVGYFTDELGYEVKDLESLMYFDYDKYASESEMNGDVSFVEMDHKVYAFSPR